MSFAAINRSKYSVVFVFQTKKKLIIYFHLNDSHVLTLKVSYRIEKKTQATGIIKKYNIIVYIVIILLVYFYFDYAILNETQYLGIYISS